MPSHRPEESPTQPIWNWGKIREFMKSRYGQWYTDADLRAMEVKWRKIFSAAGWKVKGQ